MTNTRKINKGRAPTAATNAIYWLGSFLRIENHFLAKMHRLRMEAVDTKLCKNGALRETSSHPTVIFRG